MNSYLPPTGKDSAFNAPTASSYSPPQTSTTTNPYLDSGTNPFWELCSQLCCGENVAIGGKFGFSIVGDNIKKEEVCLFDFLTTHSKEFEY